MKTENCNCKKKYGYHLHNCKVLTDYWKKVLDELKGEQK